MKKLSISLIFAAVMLANASFAHKVDEEVVQSIATEIVQQEIENLLNSQALEVAIEEGIKRIVRKQRAEAAQQRVQQQQVAAEVLRPVDLKRDHVYGNPDAAITLVEYSDFECPFCKRFHPTVIQLMEDNGDKLRWVYRHFPLAIHNPGAQKQAEAVECVAELQGNDAFWKFTHAIYERTQAGGTGFPLENMRPMAEEFGVDGDAFAECVDSNRMAARVKEDHQDGAAIGISGTPAGILINRQGKAHFIFGALPVEELQAMMDDLLR